MKRFGLLWLALGLLGCQQTETIQDDSDVLVSMGEHQITRQYVQAFLRSQGVSEPSQEQFKQALDQLVKEQALAMQAVKQGLKLGLDDALNIQRLQTRTMAQLAETKYLTDNPVSEDMVMAEYQRVIAEVGGLQYRVHHLLFADEIDALAVLDAIGAGQSYADAQASYLADKGQRVKNVGDIGWVNLKQVPEAFREPLQNMAVGATHDAIVISQFGAHVLHLADKQEAEPPAFEAVKANIKRGLEQKSLERYRQLAQLKAKPKMHQE